MVNATSYLVGEAYLPKFAAVLSIFCSVVIMAEVASDKQSNQGASSVSRILLSMSLGDILFSFGWFLGTWVAPSYLDYLRGTNHGTHGTCAAQGFIVEFGGLASLFSNASLAVIYLLMIKHNWRGKRLNRLVNHLQIVIWVVALAAAVVPLTLDMYHNTGPVCWVEALPYGCIQTWDLAAGATKTTCTAGDNAALVALGLQVLPIWACIIVDAIIFWKIYRVARNLEQLPSTVSSTQASGTNDNDDYDDYDETEAGGDPIGDEEEPVTEGEQQQQQPPMDDSRQKVKRSRIVAWQSLWYISGFFLTYSLSTISLITYLSTGEWIDALAQVGYFFLALQGVWNWLIFSRRREMRTRVGKVVRAFLWEGVFGCGYCRKLVLCCHRVFGCGCGCPQKAETVIERKSSTSLNANNNGENATGTLPPIDEGEENISGARYIAVRLRGRFSQMRISHFLSDLGASGYSIDATEDMDPSIRESTHRLHMMSEGDGQLMPPTRRIATSEVDTPPPPTTLSTGKFDTVPRRPERYETETDTLPSAHFESESEPFPSKDSLTMPPQPCLVVSEAETEGGTTATISPPPPLNPRKSKMEDSSETMAPVKPPRFETEFDAISTSMDEDA